MQSKARLRLKKLVFMEPTSAKGIWAVVVQASCTGLRGMTGSTLAAIRGRGTGIAVSARACPRWDSSGAYL